MPRFRRTQATQQAAIDCVETGFGAKITSVPGVLLGYGGGKQQPEWVGSPPTNCFRLALTGWLRLACDRRTATAPRLGWPERPLTDSYSFLE
jgi:hypothetical protein